MANAFGAGLRCCGISRTLAYVKYASAAAFPCALPRTKIIAPNRGSWGFSERTPEVLTNLSCWRFVFCRERITAIDSLLSPLRGTPVAYLNAPLACFLAYVSLRPRLFLAPCPASKIIAPNRGSWGFSERTPEVLTNLLCWRFVLCWKQRVGIEALAKSIFVRGYAPSMAGMPHARPCLALYFER